MDRQLVMMVVLPLALGALFVGLGVRVLLRGRVTVVNPDHRSASPGLFGALVRYHRRQTGLQNDFLVPSSTIEATGAEAKGYAALYLVLGALFVGAAVFSLVMG